MNKEARSSRAANERSQVLRFNFKPAFDTTNIMEAERHASDSAQKYSRRSIIRGKSPLPLKKHSSPRGPYSSIHVNPTPKGTRRICLHWRSDDTEEDYWFRCCWLATKPFSDYDMIETQVMVTPKRKSVDVNRMHLEYKWELPINHDLEAIGMRLDATEGEGRSAFFVLRDDQRPAKVAFLCKTGAARKRVSICIPTEQDLVKKRLFGGRPVLILDCLHIANSLVAWSHAFVLRPFADGGRVELLPGFGSVTGLERGLLRYRSDLLNPKERPKAKAEFLARLEDFYTRIGRYVDSLGCNEPWKEYLRREVRWAEEVLSRFSTDDDAPHRYTDLFRERKIRVTAVQAASAVTTTEQDKSQQKWSYDVLKETLTEIFAAK